MKAMGASAGLRFFGWQLAILPSSVQPLATLDEHAIGFPNIG